MRKVESEKQKLISQLLSRGDATLRKVPVGCIIAYFILVAYKVASLFISTSTNYEIPSQFM